GRNDVAILLQQKSTGKMGIGIFHAKRPQAIYTSVTVLGAGKTLGGAGDDFRWGNTWKEIPENTGTLRGITLKGDAIMIGRRDSTRGVIWWNDGSYEWTRRKK